MVCLLFYSCTPSHILHTQERTSREYTYVDFIRNQDPFSMHAQVGGEQIKAVKILGFEGDKYLVEFTRHKGEVKFNIQGEGILFKKTSARSGTIFVRNLDAIATIDTWAHPSAEYTLSITPLKPKISRGFNLFFWQD